MNEKNVQGNKTKVYQKITPRYKKLDQGTRK